MEATRENDACGVGIRGVAMAIDSFVWFGLLFVGVYAVAAVTGQIEVTNGNVDASLQGGAGMAALGLSLGLGVAYHALLEWWAGRTIGKALVAIRVVTEDGTTPSAGASLARNVVRLVDWLPLFYVVGIATMAFSSDSQRLGDRLAGTTVVRT
ncbi:RDD family protein [Halorubellus salinus]|uniref:RDD family protein n=1 Tax=Halorubellus salinus TaxID=755309 RepID=UPI001D05F9A9|nr:RDD family protein [Halorubellus salinus]